MIHTTKKEVIGKLTCASGAATYFNSNMVDEKTGNTINLCSLFDNLPENAKIKLTIEVIDNG